MLVEYLNEKLAHFRARIEENNAEIIGLQAQIDVINEQSGRFSVILGEITDALDLIAAKAAA